MKVIHIITGLNTGGAEMVLYKLLSVMDQEIYTAEVISLTDIGPIGKKIKSLGVQVNALRMRRGIPGPLAVLKLASWLSQLNADVIQTWMYHADLVGGIAAKLAGGVPVIWGVHHYNLEFQHNKRSTIWTAMLCAKLSRWLPRKIVCCSNATRQAHMALGYISERMVVVSNGIDLSDFKPDSAARESIRKELGIPQSVPLIGMVARFDPQKDHKNFVDATRMLGAEYPDAHFLLCGDGVTWDNQSLICWIDNAGMRRHFHLLGVRQDIASVTAALDIATSSSFGESFSLTMGEAMACGIPCVTTNLEAPVDLLGGYGWIVPIHDSRALCHAWREILGASGEARKKCLDAARERIRKHFSLESMAEGYQHLFVELHRDS